ncbi:MAG TPA: energy transducer TonB [Candidatus Aquilonibacter sp.]|nr:energy transducer TonB [Candidatus Aquilonibacter sp.]
MFADTLDSSWPERSRRGWATLTSFGLQVLLAGLLLFLPLLYPGALPILRRLETPVSLGRPLAELPAIAPTNSGNSAVRNATIMPILIIPPQIPLAVERVSDAVGAPPDIGVMSEIPGSPVGVRGATPFSVGEGFRPVIPALPPPINRTVRLSHMSEGDLIRKVQPLYPPIARNAGIEGKVVLEAVINREGTIENLHVIAGHPLLVRAALEAVSQWRYRPYLLNNEPVEVQTEITVNFVLNRN